MPTKTVARGHAGERIDKGLVIVEKSGRLFYKSTIYSKHFPNGEKAELWPLDSITRTAAKQRHEARRVEVLGVRGPIVDKTLRFVMEECCAFIEAEAEREGKNKTYARQLRNNFAKHVEPFGIADLKLSHFDETIALNFLRYLRGTQLTGGAQLAILNCIRRPLRHAREQGYMTKQFDPFRGHPRKEYPRIERSENVLVLDNEQVAELIRVVTSQKYRALTTTDYSNAVLVNLLEGDRTSETIGRTWADVELDERMIAVNAQAAADGSGARVQTKTGRTRRKHMHDLTHAALVRQRQIEWGKGRGRDDDPLFTDWAGALISRWDLLRAVKRAGRLAGLGNVTPRDLRRSFCTAMHHAGVAGAEAAAETGHSLETWERFYVRPRNNKAQSDANHAALKQTGYGYVPEAL